MSVPCAPALRCDTFVSDTELTRTARTHSLTDVALAQLVSAINISLPVPLNGIRECAGVRQHTS